MGFEQIIRFFSAADDWPRKFSSTTDHFFTWAGRVVEAPSRSVRGEAPNEVRFQLDFSDNGAFRFFEMILSVVPTRREVHEKHFEHGLWVLVELQRPPLLLEFRWWRRAATEPSGAAS